MSTGAESSPVQAQESKMQACNRLGAMYFELDGDGCLKGSNPLARSFFGLPEKAETPFAIGIKTLIKEEPVRKGFFDHYSSLSPEKPQMTTCVPVPGDKWCQLTTEAKFGPNGKPIQYETTGVDVTLSVRMAAQAAQAQIERAQQAQQSALDTAARIAHDVRSPAALIKGYLDVFDSPDITLTEEDRVMAFKAMKNNADRIGVLANEYLQLMSLENGSIVIERLPVPMDLMIEELREEFAFEQHQKKAKIHYQPDMPSPLGSSNLVHQVLANYISNAIKYGGGEPEITVQAVPMADGKIRYEVKDNGQGIPEDRKEKLFTKFGRLGLPEHNGIPGVGLGLSIVKKMIELQGGEVGVDSEVGKGSIFYFVLPAAEIGVAP